MANTFGSLFRLTSFGESHGSALGGIVDGCPAGVPLSVEQIQKELDARRPGQDKAGLASTARREPDSIEILSGVFEAVSTGTPIGFIIRNQDQQSKDYSAIKDIFRPGHADITFEAKYGRRDYRGGGRSSARETVSRVAGGAIAQAFLAQSNVNFRAFTVELASIVAPLTDTAGAEQRAYCAPDAAIVAQWDAAIHAARKAGDTVGGIVQVEAYGLPAGWGDPVFDKLDARIAAAFMSVGAVKGVEIGSGFAAARMRGSQHNDAILPATTQGVNFASNNAGGILGGISTGQPLIVRAAVKPIPSIALPQQSITRTGEATEIIVGGRHDCCAIPRIVPVLKAMLALCLADAMLAQRCSRVE